MILTDENKDQLLLFMDMRHPGWRDIVQSMAWDEWLRRQPPEYQERLNTTWSPTDVGHAIHAFEEWQEFETAFNPPKRKKRRRRRK